jgi:hypothetical protein
MTDGGEWVPDVTSEAMRRVCEHADKVGLTNTEEFTFRAFFMAATYDMAVTFGLLEGLHFHTEWRSFDLLVRLGGIATLLEFKYYVIRRTYNLDGTHGDFKGGPGPQNWSEFTAALHKLHAAMVPGLGPRRLVVVYKRDDMLPKGQSWHKSFGDLEPDESIARIWPRASGPLEARIFKPTPPPEQPVAS